MTVQTKALNKSIAKIIIPYLLETEFKRTFRVPRRICFERTDGDRVHTIFIGFTAEPSFFIEIGTTSLKKFQPPQLFLSPTMDGEYWFKPDQDCDVIVNEALELIKTKAIPFLGLQKIEYRIVKVRKTKMRKR